MKFVDTISTRHSVPLRPSLPLLPMRRIQERRKLRYSISDRAIRREWKWEAKSTKYQWRSGKRRGRRGEGILKSNGERNMRRALASTEGKCREIIGIWIIAKCQFQSRKVQTCWQRLFVPRSVRKSVPHKVQSAKLNSCLAICTSEVR